MAGKPRDPKVMIALLEKHGPDFTHNGSLIYRNEPGRRPCWCLRFRVKDPETGEVRQKSISLGTNPAVADDVGHFLAAQRHKRTVAKQQAKDRLREEQEAKRRRREEEKACVKALCEAHNYSRRSKKRIRAIVSGENPDASELIRLSVGVPLRTRRRGRPFKNRLW